MADGICRTPHCTKLAHVDEYDGWTSGYCEWCLDNLENEYRERKEWEHAHTD